MDQGVDDGFSQDDQRNAPHIFALHGAKASRFVSVLFQKQLYLRNRIGQVGMNVLLVKNLDLVSPTKAPALHPCVGKMQVPFLAKQQYRALCRNQTALLWAQQLQGLKGFVIDFVACAQPVREGRQIQIIHAQVGHRLLVKHLPRRTAVCLGNPVWASLAVARTQPLESALRLTQGLEMVRAVAAGVHLHHQQGGLAHADEFYIGNQTRCDAIGNQVADALFLGQRVGHSDDLPRIVHANNELAASGIGKCHQGFEQVARRRQVALEFQLLASRLEPQGYVGTHGVHGASAALVRTSRAKNSATLMKLRSQPMRCAAGWFKVCAVKR